MATPHISGFDTYLLSLDNTLAPDQIATAISDKALDEILSGFREFCLLRVACPTTLKSTPPVAEGNVNKLLNNQM